MFVLCSVLDLELLQSCMRKNLATKFFQFKVVNKRLGESEACFQRRLLSQEIFIKFKTIQ